MGKIAEKYRWLVVVACPAAIVGYYAIGGYVAVMLVMFSLFLIYALGNNRGVLQNPVTKFLSGISREI